MFEHYAQACVTKHTHTKKERERKTIKLNTEKTTTYKFQNALSIPCINLIHLDTYNVHGIHCGLVHRCSLTPVICRPTITHACKCSYAPEEVRNRAKCCGKLMC